MHTAGTGMLGKASHVVGRWMLCVLAVGLVAPYFVCFALGKPGQEAWIPADAMTDDIGARRSEVRLQPMVYTKTPKATADMSEFTRVYELELEKFGISNDGTKPVETSKGINAALQYAKKAGKNRIVFPEGTYLIGETDPVLFNHPNTIVDLNGATLKINPNGLRKYHVVEVGYGCDDFRLTNGTIAGDKLEHDYAKGGEWGTCLALESGSSVGLPGTV